MVPTACGIPAVRRYLTSGTRSMLGALLFRASWSQGIDWPRARLVSQGVVVQYACPSSGLTLALAHASGLLHTLYTAARFLLYRPVMRWSFIVPPRFELNCDVPAWLDLVSLSRVALEWAAQGGRDSGEESAETSYSEGTAISTGGTMAGVLAYALGVAACVQYHTWARRGEWEGAVVLERAANAVARWSVNEGVLMRRVSV